MLVAVFACAKLIVDSFALNIGGNTVPGFRIKIPMGWSDTGFFSEKYRVVAVEAERLTIKGIITGTVLTITNSDPATPLTAEQYPLGKLIALSDPSASAPD